MAGLVEYVALIVSACLIWSLFFLALRLLAGDCPGWLRSLHDRLRPSPPLPPTPLVLHELELSRLGEMVRKTYETSQPARAFRVGAASAAYDMELLAACRTLGLVGPDGRPPLSAQARLDTETKLLAAGLRW